MPLTRPSAAQINTVITTISDPITVLNKGSTAANIDVGFIINRNGGALANTAIFWNESANTFATAFTTASGATDANISISAYANLKVSTLTATFVNTTGNVSTAVVNAGQINTTGNVLATTGVFNNVIVNTGNVNSVGGYFVGNGYFLTGIVAGSSYSNVQVATYLPTYTGNIANIRLGIAGVLTFADGTTQITAGGGGTPGGGNGQLQFNSSSAFAGAASLYYFGANGAIVANAGIASTSTTTGTMQITGGVGLTGNVWADQIYAVNNGNGRNIRIGDDAWLGDVNVTDTTQLSGVQNSNNGYLRFGNVGTETLGRAGAGTLTWTGGFGVSGPLYANATTVSTSTTTGALIVAGGIGAAGAIFSAQINTTGNVLSTGLSIFGNARVGLAGAVSGQFHTVVGNITQTSSGGAVYINTTGNISAAIVNTSALNATGTTTAVAINSTGFINTTANISAAVVNAGALNATGNLTASQVAASNGIFVNNMTIAASYTIPTGYGASSVGAVTINSGVVVTVSSGSRWVVL